MTLAIRDLSVTINDRTVLDRVTFTMDSGQRLGVIGSSGSGKTLLALAIAGLLPAHAVVTGSIVLNGIDLLSLSERELARLRGDRIGMVFQEPKSALNPLQKLGTQITEALTVHYALNRQQRQDAARQLAQKVGFSEPERIVDSYPHQVSGGQRQRVAIAAAISTEPEILIADEPTTALDVSVQHDILDLFRRLTEAEQMSLIFITHDIAVLSEMVSHAVVLDAGQLVEAGTISQIIHAPQHPVTQELVAAARASEAGFFGGGEGV